jgi:hypothetical protein
MAVLDSRPTLEAPDDPYLWLEEIESARVLDCEGNCLDREAVWHTSGSRDHRADEP